jgi:uncharacterized membrane protein SpoIIM required for sporulation
MDYARFVAAGAPDWDAFEKRLEAAERSPRDARYADLEGLALRHRRVLHDLALATDRYAGTAAARRLSVLALRGAHWLHADRSAPRPRLRSFWRRAFPAAIRGQAPEFALATSLFVAALVLGLTLAVANPSAGFALLGPSAVAELREGKLWTQSLTHAIPPAVSSSGIAANNMAVALTGWAGGALAGLGSLYVVVMNGFVLGAVLAATVHFSLAGELLSFVAAHGPLEITLILTTAAAGFTLGRGLFGADDRPRRVAAAEAGRRALHVLVGCLPWFVVLGLIEGFISPAPTVGVGVKVTLGVLLESLFLVVAWRPPSLEA